MVGTSSKLVSKNALPILAYYDIFKNYYANTQEDNFYTIGGTLPLQATYEGTEIPNSGNNIALSNGDTMVVNQTSPSIYVATATGKYGNLIVKIGSIVTGKQIGRAHV